MPGPPIDLLRSSSPAQRDRHRASLFAASLDVEYPRLAPEIVAEPLRIGMAVPRFDADKAGSGLAPQAKIRRVRERYLQTGSGIGAIAHKAAVQPVEHDCILDE